MRRNDPFIGKYSLTSGFMTFKVLKLFRKPSVAKSTKLCFLTFWLMVLSITNLLTTILAFFFVNGICCLFFTD